MKPQFILIITMIAFLLTPCIGQAKSSQTQDPWTLLSDLADQVSQSVDLGDTKAALTFVQAFSKDWTNDQKVLSNQLSDVKIRTLNAALDTLQKDLQVQADPIKLKRSSAQFRLAVDALSGDPSPIWLSMGNQILTSFNAVKKDVQSGNDQQFQVDLNQFLDLYQMVYPSMTIDLSPQEINKIETDIVKLTNSRMTFIQNRSQNKTELQAISQDLNRVFAQQLQGNPYFQKKSINPLIFSIGMLILLPLLYVGWRKYRGSHPVPH